MMSHGTRVIVLIAGLSTAISFLPSARVTAQEPFAIKRTALAPRIDGNLDEPAWQAAQAFSPFVFTWYTEGAKEQTEVKMLWDDSFLYVAFTCFDAHIAGTRTQRNTEVYRDDCAEIFIAPNAQTPDVYMNYEINCLGTYLVRIHPPGERASPIEPSGLLIGRSHAGTINDESDEDLWWIIEMAIPFRNFAWMDFPAHPTAGTAMRLNLNRLGGTVNNQKSQWRPGDPNRPSFHNTQAFGDVVLSGELVLR